MAEFTPKDVMKLREESDAPMMECKQALTEAGGDAERAKAILREKGKAQAGKKAGRATSEGVVAFSSTPDNKIVGGVLSRAKPTSSRRTRISWLWPRRSRTTFGTMADPRLRWRMLI